ncbi:MAG: hypothetical protein O7H41_08680 [Planctomycetota bacterium]|nr:hypothetical protein [Planctomycetota bacterium]
MNSADRSTKRRLLTPARLVLYPTLAVILLCAWGIHSMFYWQGKIGGPLEEDLGFRMRGRYIQVDGKRVEALTITSVRSGGVFEQAGFRPGDIIVDDLDFCQFYKKLERARGTRCRLNVVSWQDSGDPGARAARLIEFSVPERS